MQVAQRNLAATNEAAHVPRRLGGRRSILCRQPRYPLLSHRRARLQARKQLPACMFDVQSQGALLAVLPMPALSTFPDTTKALPKYADRCLPGGAASQQDPPEMRTLSTQSATCKYLILPLLQPTVLGSPSSEREAFRILAVPNRDEHRSVVPEH